MYFINCKLITLKVNSNFQNEKQISTYFIGCDLNLIFWYILETFNSHPFDRFSKCFQANISAQKVSSLIYLFWKLGNIST